MPRWFAALMGLVWFCVASSLVLVVALAVTFRSGPAWGGTQQLVWEVLSVLLYAVPFVVAYGIYRLYRTKDERGE